MGVFENQTYMKQIYAHAIVISMFALAVVMPVSVNGGSSLAVAPLLNRINEHILNPVIALLTAIAILVFFWGLVQFISHPDGNQEREKGKQNILYGLIGLFIMVGVYGIIRLILGTFGIPNPPYLGL